MTKEEILNGMSEQEFYSLYPTREAWEQVQQQMAYGGMPNIMGIPFGAGVIMEEGGNLSEEYIKKARTKPGGSNVGKYNPNQTFAGPSGGAPKGSYPIGDIQHARSALKLAHNAPNPSGIKAAVYNKYPSLKKQAGGTMTQDLEGTYPSFGYGGYDSPFNYGQFPGMAHGGNTTSQGGNQDFLNNRNNTYLNYIQNNVLKNIQQEESEKVQNAFMQMENSYRMGGAPCYECGGYHMQGGGSYDMLNQQNLALQNMYGQQMQQYQDQHAQDRAAFANLFLPQAAEGAQQPDHGALLHQFAEEFGPRSRRTGLPLFPANLSPYYQIGKKDAAKLAGLPKNFKMEGLEITPKWGLGARTAMNIGNLFRSKENDRTTPGWAPKSIHYKFTGKRGYMPGEPRPDTHETVQQSAIGPKTTYDQANPYGPIPAGTTQASVPYLPSSIRPGYNASGKMINEKYPGLTPSYISSSSQFNTMAYGGDYFDGGGNYPTLFGTQNNPIDLKGSTTNQWSFAGQQSAPTPTAAGVYGKPALSIDTRNQTEDSPYVQGSQVQYDAAKDRSNEDITVEGDIDKKWKGIRETIGQYAIPTLNFVSSGLENKNYKKFKKKMEASMLADNAFVTTPLNAKNRGDYDINSGILRSDDYVPVQFPGYAQWGGFNTMATGGITKFGPGGAENDGVIPVVKEIPKGFVPSKDKPGTYEKTTTFPGNVKPGNVTPVDPSKRTKDAQAYQNTMIDMVKSGKSTIEDLVSSGRITPEFAKTLAPYSKKEYIRLEEQTSQPVKSPTSLKDSDIINRKQIWTSGNQNQFYDTFLYPDVNAGYSQATTRYFDRKTGQEVNPSKSFDAQGNYVASFMQGDPNTVAGTVKATRYNTPIGSATDNAITNTLSSGFKWGGFNTTAVGGSYEKDQELRQAQSGLEVKMNPGLYGTNGNSQFNKSAHLEAGKISQKPTEVRNSLTAVPRDKANLEAEGGETAIVNVDGIPAHFKISGPRHTNGGVPLDLPDNSFIFSDTAKMKIKDPNILAQFGMKPKRGGYTPADISKKYDINKFRKILADPNTDDMQRKTAEMMIANYNEKLAKLALAQESIKGFPQGIPVIAMPYIENMQMNPATFLPDQAQEQLEGAEQPDADMGTARYGSQVINQFPIKRYGGLPKAQSGLSPNTAPKKSKEETSKDLDVMERRILGTIQDLRSKGLELPTSITDAYKKVDTAKRALGQAPESKPYKGEMSWVTAEGNPIDDPKQGATGYWDRVGQHWSNDFDPYNVDPKELERVSKLKGYSFMEVPTKRGKAAQEIVSKLNPYNSEGIIDYAGNILSAPQKGINAALTGNIETPGITYLRTNPGNEGTALLIDVVSDPLTYLGPKGIEYGVKGAYKGVQKFLPYAKDLAEFTIKYGKQAGKYLAENLPKLGKYISKKGIEALKSEVVQNLALASIARAGSYGSYQKANEEFSGKNEQIEKLKNELEQLKQAKQDTTSVLQPAKPKVDTTKVAPADTTMTETQYNWD